MIRNEIIRKRRRLCFDCAWLGYGRSSRTGRSFRRTQMYLRAVTRRQVVLDIALFDEAHRGSRRSVAYLNGARPERSLECWRREKGKPTTSVSIRSKPCVAAIYYPRCRERTYEPIAVKVQFLCAPIAYWRRVMNLSVDGLCRANGRHVRQ